jgi:hypothetical protein
MPVNSLHRATRRRALPARLGTSPTMGRMFRMLFTLCRTRIARLGTCGAQTRGELACARHYADRCGARVSAIAVETNALRHIHLFIKTRIAAHLTRDETLDARFDAGFIVRCLVLEVLTKLDCRHVRSGKMGCTVVPPAGMQVPAPGFAGTRLSDIAQRRPSQAVPAQPP